MTFRKIPLTFLILTMAVVCAHAKKQPKYEQARQLTAEQAALVQRAIAQEKVLIKNIQQRTPLVETYIQDTRPDVKLYTVPVDDQYMLSRVDFGKGFFDKTYEPKAASQEAGLLQGLVGRHYGADQGAGPGDSSPTIRNGFHADDVPRPVGLRPAALCLQLCAPRVSGIGAHLGLRRASQGGRQGHGPLLRAHLDRGPGRQRGALQRHLHRPHLRGCSRSTTSTSTAGG